MAAVNAEHVEQFCLLWAHRWWPWGDPWFLCMEKDHWAAWVQAIFSVIAIFASAAIGAWLLRVEQRATRLHQLGLEVERIEQTSALLKFAASRVSGMASACVNSLATYKYSEHGIANDYAKETAAALELLNETHAPHPALLVHLLKAKSVYSEALAIVGDSTFSKLPQEDLYKYRMQLESISGEIELAAGEFDNHCLRLRAGG